LVLVAALAGCAGVPPQVKTRTPFATPGRSPVAAEVAPADAWRLAESFAASHQGCEVLIGRGGSMLPLYRDQTVLVVRAQNMTELEAGMTVVFIGSRGQMVAHTLVEHTPRGWTTAGLANNEADRTPVRFANYVGTVVRAYAPNPDIAPLGRGFAVQTAMAQADSAAPNTRSE
jgi:hypothetical protein